MKRAFTLMELMIVLFILAILICTMRVHIKDKRFQSEAKSIVECVKIYETTISMYYVRHNAGFPLYWSGRKLEDIEPLKLYRPTNFKTMSGIPTAKCPSINTFQTSQNGSLVDYGVQITINGDENLANEIVSQLDDFAVSSQITNEKENNTYTIKFYLKKGNDIYI